MTKDEEFHFDILRTILLSKYICHWGHPEKRLIAEKKGQRPVELYIFPGDEGSKVVRFASIGISEQQGDSGEKLCSHELLLVLPSNLGGAKKSDVSDFFFDVMAYSLRPDVTFVPERTVPETKLSPKIWRQKALLIDEPHGEADEVRSFDLGGNKVNLLWIVPIYGAEQQIINDKGVEWFDAEAEKEDLSIVDLARECFVQ